MSARFELCECGHCSGYVVLANGFSGLQVCSKEEARLSAEAAWFRCDITIQEFRDILVSIERSALPERVGDVASDIRMETLHENLRALGRINGPAFAWDEDLLEENVLCMIREDPFIVQDIGPN